MPLLINDLLNHDRYRIDELLYTGGMGAVYKAWDFNLQIPVAIKENLNTSPEAQKQFNKEAGMLARLSHAHLPRVTDYFTVPGQGEYLVMDYIEGEDLRSMLNRLGHLPEDQVLAWIGQVADALNYLHNQNPPIIHRDIKPGNIRISKDGRAVLVDFGIAKWMEPDQVTTMGARLVTPGYSPPEQYGGGHTDRRSDIYALGATLYHLLTGQEPPESIQRMIRMAELSPPRKLNRAISPQVEQVIIKAVEIETNQRYQNIEELLASLYGDEGGVLSAATASGLRARSAGSPPPSKNERPRHRTSAWLVAGVIGLLALAAFAAFVFVGKRPAASPAAPASSPAVGSAVLLPPTREAEVQGGAGLGAASASDTPANAPAAAAPTALETAAVAEPPTQAAPTSPPAAATQALSSSPAGVEATPSVSPAAPVSPAPTSASSAPGAYRLAARLLSIEGQAIRSVAAGQGFAYVLTKRGSLLTYDLTSLTPGGDLQTFDSPGQRLTVKNTTGMLRVGAALYVYGQSGFEVLDLSQPANPTPLSQQKDLIIMNMVAGERYLAALGQGIAIYDISDPLHPQPFKKLPPATGVTNFAGAFYQDRLYISEYVVIGDKVRSLLKVYDFSNPAEIREIQRIDPGELAYQLLAVGDSLLRCTSNDVELWDLTDKNIPAFRGSIPGRARACTADQGVILINGAALTVSQGALQTLASFETGASTNFELYPYGSAVSDGYIFLALPDEVVVLSGTQ